MRLKAIVEELEVENKSLWRAITNYESHYSELCEKMQKEIKQQEETIKYLIDLCEPLLEERLAKSLEKVNDILELSLKDLFSSEPTKKCKKGVKSSAEKCKKCGETKKGEEKCSVAKKKSKK